MPETKTPAPGRTRLLNAIPQWELPRYLDSLQEATA